jgi:hypothetical protein
MKTQFVDFLVMNGHNGIVGADEIAHAAPHTGMGRVRPLLDAVIDAIHIARLFLQTDGNVHHALPVDAEINRPDGTDGRAPATEVASLLAPEDSPGKILRA